MAWWRVQGATRRGGASASLVLPLKQACPRVKSGLACALKGLSSAIVALSVAYLPADLESKTSHTAGPSLGAPLSFTAACRLGISGVPYFIVGAAGDSGRRYALSGAQPASAFAKAFAKVLEEQGD